MFPVPSNLLPLIRCRSRSQSGWWPCQRVHEIINKSEHQYVTACHNFDALYTEMVTAMEPTWDIETAIHCLTLGSYRNLPKIIDHSIVRDVGGKHEALSAELVSSTLYRLNNALRVRLLGDDIPPRLKLLDIHRGMVRMVAAQQFEVSLSLRMRPKLLEDAQSRHRDAAQLERERIRWSLFELRLLLKASTATNPQDTKAADDSRFIVTDYETQALLLAVNEKMKRSASPLQVMYRQLNAFCLQLQFAVLKRQIDAIRYTFGAHNIRIEEKAKCITIRLWRFAADLPLDISRGANSGEDSNGVPSAHQQSQHQRADESTKVSGADSVRDRERAQSRHREQEQKLMYQLQQQQLQLQSTNYSKPSRSVFGSSYRDTNTNLNLDAVDEFQRKENALKLQFKVSLTILCEEQGLALSYHPTFPSFVTDGTANDGSSDTDSIGGDFGETLDGHRGIASLLRVNPSNLNLPALIGRFTVLHANYRLLYVLGKLVEVDKEYHIRPAVRVASPMAEEGRGETLFPVDDEKGTGSLTAGVRMRLMAHLGRKHISICLCRGKFVEIYCNEDNGRMVVEKAYHEMVSTAPLGFEKNLRVYNADLNRDLSSIPKVVKALKIDCLLENVVDVVQSQLHWDVVSYAPCTKPAAYFVYPSLLMHHHRRPRAVQRLKKSVTIQPPRLTPLDSETDRGNTDWKLTGAGAEGSAAEVEDNGTDGAEANYRAHVIQTYTQILSSWNERNSVFVSIPRFGKHCHLVIHFRSHIDAETYCIVCDHLGNLLYLRHIVRDDVLPMDGDTEMKPKWIEKYVDHCTRLLPRHLVRIMVTVHTGYSMKQLLWREDSTSISCTFEMVLPRPATTCNVMHIMPRQFGFEVALESNADTAEPFASFRWTCCVKQEHLFTRHRESLLSKLGGPFQFEGDALRFEFVDCLHLGQMTRICSYCFKLVVVHNILRGFLDHKQAVKQNSAFFPRDFYVLKRVDIDASPSTTIEIEFCLFSKHEVGYQPVPFQLTLDIVWNEVENVEFYSDSAFNPFVSNPEYQIRISFGQIGGASESASIYQLVPNLRLLIAHYFAMRQRYQRKLSLLLFGMEDEDSAPFSAHDAMTTFKELIGQSRTPNTDTAVHAKQQSYFEAQYESLSFLMLLQRLYWSIRTLNHLHPLLRCLNAMSQWYYPKVGRRFIRTAVRRHDTLQIKASFPWQDEEHNGMDNILALRILSERRVSVHRIDARNGWQCTLEHIEFGHLSQRLLVHIQRELLAPRKEHFLSKMFATKAGDGEGGRTANRLMAVPPPCTRFDVLRVGLLRHQKAEDKTRSNKVFGVMLSVLNVDGILENKLNFKPLGDGQRSIYLYQQTLTMFLKQLCPSVAGRKYKENMAEATTLNLQFVGNVMKAYFHLFCDMEQGYALYHELKVHSFLSVVFLSALHFIEINNLHIADPKRKCGFVAKALLSMQELFALLYDEMLQLSLFGGRMDCIGASYFKKTRFVATVPLTSDVLFWYNLHHAVDHDIIFEPRSCGEREMLSRPQVLCVRVHFAEIMPMKRTKSSLRYHSAINAQRGRSPSATISLTPSPEKVDLSPTPPPATSGRGKARTRGGRARATSRTRGGKIKKRGGKFTNGCPRSMEEEHRNGHLRQLNGEGSGVRSEREINDKCTDRVDIGGIQSDGGDGADSKTDDSKRWAFERHQLQNSLVLNLGVELKQGGEHRFGSVFFYQTYPRRPDKFRRMGIAFLPRLNALVQSINTELAQRGYPGGLLASFMRQLAVSLTEMKRTNIGQFRKIWSELEQLVQ